MTNLKESIAIFLCTILPITGFAQTSCQPIANVYFINGVDKPDEAGVRADAKELRKTVAKFSENSSVVKQVTYLYNDSDGLFLDLVYELASQKAVERNTAIANVILDVGFAALGLFSNLNDTEQLTIRREVARKITSVLPLKTQTYIDVFSARVTGESLTKRVQAILVSHSQGNMFSNAIYDNIKLSLTPNLFRGLAVVSVASPAASTRSGLYLTAYQDLVINLLASMLATLEITQGPMSPNFDASLNANFLDVTGHGFTKVYLSESLPSISSPANSIAAALVSKIDAAIRKTSTFYDTPNYILDSAGNKVPRPAWLPVDSSSVKVCFPDPVGGL